MEPPPPQPQPRHRLTSASLSGLLPHGGRIEEGGTARAAPARTGQPPACCATATAPRASRGRGPLAGPCLLASRSPRLTSSLTEGGLRRGEPLARPPRGQETARLLRDRYCATGEPWSWTHWPAPRLSASRSPRLTSSLTEGGLRRGEPLARPPRGQGQPPACCATATAPRASRGRGPLADPRPASPSPRLTSSLTEGGLRRGEPLARPPRGQDNRPPAARPLLRHGRAVVVDH